MVDQRAGAGLGIRGGHEQQREERSRELVVPAGHCGGWREDVPKIRGAGEFIVNS